MCLGPLKSAGSLSLTMVCVWPDLTCDVLIVLNKEMLHFEYPHSIKFSRDVYSKQTHCIAFWSGYCEGVMRFAHIYCLALNKLTALVR